MLGGSIDIDPQGYATLRTPEGLAIDFLRVPEPKTGKNGCISTCAAASSQPRSSKPWHWRTRADDIYAGGRWQVLRDPEGNEFCILRPRA